MNSNNNSTIVDLKKHIEEYQILQLSKDEEISKLNDIITSKQNEINRLNKMIEDLKNNSPKNEESENSKNEILKLNNKINEYELKIYDYKDQIEKLNTKINELSEFEKNYENLKNENSKLLNRYNEIISNGNMKNYIEELEILQKTISDYKTGKLISEKTKQEIDLIKNESISQIKELQKKLNKINEQNTSKTVKYESMIMNLKNENRDSENIILKQEDKISQLLNKISEFDEQMHLKEILIKNNEAYSNQLINIINEQKVKIKKMKSNKSDQNNDQIKILMQQIEKLKEMVEIKENMLEVQKKAHKNLQMKYMKKCFDIRKNEQEELIRQVERLKKQKMERDILFSLRMGNSSSSKQNNLIFSKSPVNLKRGQSQRTLFSSKGKKALVKNQSCKNIASENNHYSLSFPEIPNTNKINIENNENLKNGEDIVNDLEVTNKLMEKIIEEN